MHLFPRLIATVAVATQFLFGASVCHAQTVPSSAAQSAEPPPQKRRIPPLGLDVEAVHFLGSKTRSRFGSAIVSLSPGVGGVTPPLQGQFDLDLSVTSASGRRSGKRNTLFLVSIGPEYKSAFVPASVRRALREAQATRAGKAPPKAQLRPPPFLPYYGASLSAIYANIKSPSDGVDGSGFGAGGSLFVGLAIKRRAFVEARLRATTQVKGFNFSGAGLTFGLRF